MAISIVNKKTVTYSSGSASIVVDKPVNTAQNDVMVAFLVIEENANRINSVPDGWQVIVSNCPGPGTRHVWLAIYWKLAGASEGASYTWGLNASDECMGAIVTFRGINTSSPIGYASLSSDAGSSVSHQAPSIIVQNVGNWVLHSYATALGTTYTPSADPEYTEELDFQTGSGTANLTLGMSWREYSATGATNDIIATSGSKDYWITSLVELKVSAERRIFVTHQ